MDMDRYDALSSAEFKKGWAIIEEHLMRGIDLALSRKSSSPMEVAAIVGEVRAYREMMSMPNVIYAKFKTELEKIAKGIAAKEHMLQRNFEP